MDLRRVGKGARLRAMPTTFAATAVLVGTARVLRLWQSLNVFARAFAQCAP
jgi:hypothetical protein